MIKSTGKLFASIFGNLSVSGKTFHPSETCPECGAKLAAWRDESHESKTESISANQAEDSCNASLRNEDAAWHCPNLDCPGRTRERIEHWCSPEAMSIPGADQSLVAQLVNRGLVRDVAELYSLKPAEVAGLEGRDKEFAKSFLEAVIASKSREAWRVLYGLDIPHVDVEVARQLCRHFTALDDILAAGPESLLKQAGVSEAVARSIAFWYGDGVNRRLVRRLQRAGVNFKTGH